MDTKTLSPIQRFWSLLRPDRKEIRNIYVYAFFYGLVNLSLPLGIQSIINLIQGAQISTAWIVLVFFVILGIAITGILQIQQLRITENLQQKIFTRAAFEFAYRIPRIKSSELYNHYAPELMNRFFDVVSVQKGLSKILIDFSTASIQTIFGLLLLSLYHPFFVVFSLILVALVFAIFKLTSKKGLETSLVESKSKYTVAHWLEEVARTGVTFKLAGQSELPMRRIDKTTGQYIEARESHFKVLINQYSLMVVFRVLVAAGLLIAGSLLVMEQQMNIGQFVAAEIIILLVLSSVEKLILSLETIYDVLTSLEKIGQVTDMELESNEGMNIQEVMSEEGFSIELNDVNYSYPDRDKLIFNSTSFKINSGEKVLICGESDSGKATLLYLLAGLYKVNSGSISINGIPLGNLNPNQYRASIGDCLMDELLFEGTLLENITMERDKATFANVQWAIKNLGLESFIRSLPNGYNTIINPQGKQFSKGIIDKLILARSIADKPNLLLIKDAFTSLVGEERKRLLQFITSPENPWTLVIASQDPGLKSMVDRSFELQNEKIIES